MEEPLSVPAEQTPCTIHKYHGTAKPARTVWHHIWPKGWGGPDYKPGHDGGVWTCDNGHYTVHRLLDWYRKQDGILRDPENIEFGDEIGLVESRVVRMKPPFHVSISERTVARQGYYDWASNGRPTGKGGE
jgi:hypothetical protein